MLISEGTCYFRQLVFCADYRYGLDSLQTMRCSREIFQRADALFIDHEIPEVKEFQRFPLTVQTFTCVLFEFCDRSGGISARATQIMCMTANTCLLFGSQIWIAGYQASNDLETHSSDCIEKSPRDHPCMSHLRFKSTRRAQ